MSLSRLTFFRYRWVGCIVALLFICSSCNDSIFIDEADIPDDMSATIDGDGGMVEFIIPTSRLLHIGFAGISVPDRNVTYYNAAGEIIDKFSPASDIGSIVYHTDFRRFEIYKCDNVLKIRSIYNTFEREVVWPIWLEYDFGIRHIDITALPGLPLKLVDVDYPDGLTFIENENTSVSAVRISNSGSLPSSVELLPYLNELASVQVEMSDPDLWPGVQPLPVPVPVYDGCEWGLREEMIFPDPDLTHTYEGPYRKTKVDLSLPGNSDLRVITEVKYSGVEANGVMRFLNEVADISLVSSFTVTSIYPMCYDITIEEAD